MAKTGECVHHSNSEIVSEINYMKQRILEANEIIVTLIYLLLPKNMQFHVISYRNIMPPYAYEHVTN